MTFIQPVGLSGTRYGVRIGSMAPSDAQNTDPAYALGQVANWGQGLNPFYDSYLGMAAGTLPKWTAMPYLRTGTTYQFDSNPGDLALPPRGSTAKMGSPMDILLPRAQAVDASTQGQQVAMYSLGTNGATGATLGPTSYGISVTSMAIDVAPECMLAGLDKGAYRTTLTTTTSTVNEAALNQKAGPDGATATYAPYRVFRSGPWITAAEMFANPGQYIYVGSRNDRDSVVGVTSYVNANLASLSYSFSVGAGLTRSMSFLSPWSVDFSKEAIDGWYAKDPRFRLTTPGIQLSNTVVGSTLDYQYTQATGGEFMALYGQGVAASGHSYYGTTSSATDAGSGAQMLYQDPGAPSTLGGWGFLPPPQQMILGSPAAGDGSVYMPAMSVGRDCFLDLAYYNWVSSAWHWASFDVAQSTTGTSAHQGMGADSAQANWPGGLARVQSFSIACSSRSVIVDELGNRASVGVVAQPPTVSGTFSILETDVDGLEQVLYQQTTPNVAYTVSAGAPVAANSGAAISATMVDYNSPLRVNLVLTVTTPGGNRCAMLRFVVPNVRVGTRSKRVQVGGVSARQFAFVCEDGGVASGASLVTNNTGAAAAQSGFSLQGNLKINTSAPADGFGIKAGNNGGQTGGLLIQSFYVPAL